MNSIRIKFTGNMMRTMLMQKNAETNTKGFVTAKKEFGNCDCLFVNL